MKIKFSLLLLSGVLTGCASTTPTAPITPPTVLQSNWQPVIEGSKVLIDTNCVGKSSSIRSSGFLCFEHGKVLSQNEWEIIKRIIDNYPDDKKDILINALTRYSIQYDSMLSEYNFSLSGPEYDLKSSVTIGGKIKNNTILASVTFKYYGSGWIFAEKIISKIDGELETTDTMHFSRSTVRGSYVLEIASRPLLLPTWRDYLDRIANSKETTVRISGARNVDIEITEKMRQDIKYMLDAIDLMNNKT